MDRPFSPLKDASFRQSLRKRAELCERKPHLQQNVPQPVQRGRDRVRRGRDQPPPRYSPSLLRTANPFLRRRFDCALTESGRLPESPVGMALTSGWKPSRNYRKPSRSAPGSPSSAGDKFNKADLDEAWQWVLEGS